MLALLPGVTAFVEGRVEGGGDIFRDTWGGLSAKKEVWLEGVNREVEEVKPSCTTICEVKLFWLKEGCTSIE